MRRIEKFLRDRGWLAAGEAESLAADIEKEVRAVIERQESAAPPPVESIIDDVFQEPTDALLEQFEEARPYFGAKPSH